MRDLLLILESHEAREGEPPVTEEHGPDALWNEVDDDSDDTTGEEWKRTM